MNLGIGLRSRLLLAFIGVLAAGLTGYYAYSSSRSMLVKAAEAELLATARTVTQRVELMLDTGRRDTLLFAGHPLASRALRVGDAGADDAALAADALAEMFRQMLRVHPEYFQIRLISASGYGRERVRVDRDDKLLVRVQGDELQEKGHYPYVFNALRLQPGMVYVSRPVINHERGAHAGEGKPSLQLATPVVGPDGAVAGLVVINADLQRNFATLSDSLPSGTSLYLTNAEGDYLVHPVLSRVFAFDAGRRERVQQDFPAVAAMLDAGEDTIVTEGVQGNGLLAAFVRQRLASPQQDDYFVLGVSRPLKLVLAQSDELGRNTLQIVLGFSALSILLSALLARALTAPLQQIVEAVERFAQGEESGELPVKRRDEIGVLARSFAEMQRHIAAQVAVLRDNQRELDHLASHDSLTALPNRRMFLDRFEHALSGARRSGEQLALLFIDLDRFKEINDTLGHAAGDVVLRMVADRLKSIVRESDTVARLGGDEFIILLEGNMRSTDVAAVAQKVLDILSPAMPYEGRDLYVGASVGISQYPHDGLTAAELIVSADNAMYQAKHSGRNCYRFALPPEA